MANIVRGFLKKLELSKKNIEYMKKGAGEETCSFLVTESN